MAGTCSNARFKILVFGSVFRPEAYFTELGLFRIFTGEVGEIKT